MWKELVLRIQRRKKGRENISIFKTSYQFSSDFAMAVPALKSLHSCPGLGVSLMSRSIVASGIPILDMISTSGTCIVD